MVKALKFAESMNIDDNRILLQLYDGIAELVNGEGDNSRLVNLDIEDDNAIVVEIQDSTPAFREVLLDEIHENLSKWRVNPFSAVSYNEEGKLVFYLRPLDVIKRDYAYRAR